MKRNKVRARFCKIHYHSFWLLDHKVDIQGESTFLSKIRHHLCTKGYGRHKVTIHYIQMNPVGLRLLYHSERTLQVSKISGQN
jgi:hypothetical protein